MVQRYKKSGRVKTLKINNISADDRQALAEGRYLLYRTYNITTWQGEAQNPLADKLAAYLIRELDSQDAAKDLLTSRKLRESGWKFSDDELISAPPPKY